MIVMVMNGGGGSALTVFVDVIRHVQCKKENNKATNLLLQQHRPLQEALLHPVVVGGGG